MGARSDKSKSFMRESDFIGISNEEDEEDSGFYIDEKGKKQEAYLDLDRVFSKNSSGKLLLKKNTLLELTKEKGMNRNVVVNAINLQDYSMNQIKKIISHLTEELKKNKVKGILEFHANDTTQSSYHFHFWTWKHYEVKARAVLIDYMLEHNYASPVNVKIEGNFIRQIDKETTQEDKNKIKEENKASKIDENSEQFSSYRIIKDAEDKKIKRYRILNQALSAPTPKVEEKGNKEDLFKSLIKQAKKQQQNLTQPKKEVYIPSSFEDSEDFTYEELLKKINLLKTKINSNR